MGTVQIHRFTVPVDCKNMKNFSGEQLPDSEWYDDFGFIMLPETYSEKGESTKFVIFCHGAGGDVSVNDSQIERMTFTKYLVTNGYAVMDVNGLPLKYAEEKGVDIRNNIGSPLSNQSYSRAYKYCREHFNLTEKVYLFGASMGGISSTNLCMSGLIPVLIHGSFCPVLDTYNEIFLQPWCVDLPKVALGKIYGLKIENGDYVYDEEKVKGFNPVENATEYRDGVPYIKYPVPARFWQCVDDNVVSCEVTRKFVDAIVRAGGEAYLRTFPWGGHEPQQAGTMVEHPSGKDTFGEEKLEIFPAMEEAFCWFEEHK